MRLYTRVTAAHSSNTRRRLLHALACTSLAVLIACGGGSTSPAAPTPAPAPAAAPPAPRLLQQGGFSLPAPEGNNAYFGLATITDPAVGTWQATVDWTFGTNTLWMYVSNGACTPAQFAAPECPGVGCACQFTVLSEVATPKPRVLSIPNAPGGTRALIIVNLGPREDSGTYSVTLTPTTSLAPASASQRVAGLATASGLATGSKSLRSLQRGR